MQWNRFPLQPALLSLAVLGVGLSLGMFTQGLQVGAEESLHFKNLTAEAGIEAPGGIWGASWVDYDNDGWLDLALFAGSGRFQLWRNNGTGAFANVTEESGIIPPSAFTVGGAFADYTNNGCPDLYLTVGDEEKGLDRLYRNDCGGTFTDVTEEALIRNPSYGIGAAWGDYDKDGDLDVYVANRGNIVGGEYREEPNVLWRNNGDGTFTDVASALDVEGFSRSCWGLEGFPENLIAAARDRELRKVAFQPVWFDYDNDGWPDLFVATEEVPSPLYRNRGDGTFEEITKQAGVCIPSSNMGVAVGDYDNDGWLDLYVTNEGENFLWENQRDGTFARRSEELGIANGESLGWGTEFFDYDNDGWLDLYVANGRFGEQDFILKHDKFYRNQKGTFEDVTAERGIAGNFSTRAFAVGDYDNNGFPDFFVGASPFSRVFDHRLYQNPGNANNWIAVVPEGRASNRDGIGARIVVEAGGAEQMREVRAGSSYASQSSRWQTFGLGAASVAERVEIRWPSGELTILRDLEANRRYDIKEGKQGAQ